MAKVDVTDPELLGGAALAPAAFDEELAGLHHVGSDGQLEFCGFFAIFRGDNGNNTGKHERILTNLLFHVQEENEIILSFHGRLDGLISQRGVSNGTVGSAVGVSHVQIGKYRKEQMPAGDVLWKLARYFGVTMEWLLTGKNSDLGGLFFAEDPVPYKTGKTSISKADITAAKKRITEALEDLEKKFG